MSTREKSVRGGTPASGAQATTGDEAAALASAGATDKPTDASGEVVDTSHLTMPAVSLVEGYASDGSGRILDDDVQREGRERRAYLTHPNPPDEMPTGLKRGDGTPILVGDLRREVEREREATRVRETLVPLHTESTVVGSANPTGDGDARTVSIVSDKVVPKLGENADDSTVLGHTGDAPPSVVGATMYTRTDAPVMRSGESLDSTANTSVTGSAGGASEAASTSGGASSTTTGNAGGSTAPSGVAGSTGDTPATAGSTSGSTTSGDAGKV